MYSLGQGVKSRTKLSQQQLSQFVDALASHVVLMSDPFHWGNCFGLVSSNDKTFGSLILKKDNNITIIKTIVSSITNL